MLNNDKMIIGYDLSYQYAQISYCCLGKDAPQTYALSGTARQYNIPLCLFKRDRVNQWFLGKEAQAFAKQEEGTLLEDLLTLALEKDEITIGEEVFETIALLALYVKRSLYLPEKECRIDKVSGIMFTLPVLTDKVITLMQRLILLLNMPECQIGFQSREESVYHYVINQQKALWNNDVLIYDGNGSNIKAYRFCRNSNTRPVVAFVEETELGMLYGEDEEKDGRFAEMVSESVKVSDGCVFLLGDGFYGDWCQESLRELCHNRRVFKGNDLYSKGACLAMREKMGKDRQQSMIFLSKDKLRMNVGMQVLRQGEDSYLAIMDGGDNWYDCKKEWDIILMEGNSVILKMTPLDGRNIRNIEIILDELPQRKRGMTRLHLQAVMNNDHIMEITITDMGFGEIEPSRGLVFSQQVDFSVGE